MELFVQMVPILIPAGNASEWTGPTGNNTWLIRGAEPVLIDAGIGDPAHVEAVALALDGAPLAAVLLTHGHPDHAGGIPALRQRWPDVEVATDHEWVADNRSVPAGDGELVVLHTPGHAPDHLCFFDRESGDLYCGDLLRAGGTVVISSRQGGSLRDYLQSLERIRALGPRRLLPGHGPIVDDPQALIDEYIAHRQRRDRQVASALETGARSVDEIVRQIYPDISDRLRAAAEDTVRAHLDAMGHEDW